jgi:hypothetical protein
MIKKTKHKRAQYLKIRQKNTASLQFENSSVSQNLSLQHDLNTELQAVH